MSYRFASLWMNGRLVMLSDITEGREKARTMFEGSSFTFIREWLEGKPAFSLQTSGSTGTPKSITISRDQMTTSATLTQQALNLQPSMNALICIDTRYIGGKMMIARAFVTNMAMWIIDPDALPLQKLPVDLCVNFAAFVPYQIQSMLGSKHPHLINNADTVIIGGAALNDECIRQLSRYQSKCYAAYGMTESVSHVALRALNGDDATDFYEALPGVELSVDDRDCLVITAPFLEDKITTNDVVGLIDNRRFRWLGRWDNIINSGGYKVLPEKVEAAIQNVFDRASITNRFFIHGEPDKRLGNKVTLLVEASGNNIRPIVDILPALAKEIHPYEMPREILVSPSFTLTDTHKIDRPITVTTVTRRISTKK